MTIRIGFGALGNRPDEIVELARAGERLGFSRIWFGDHLAQPVEQKSKYPYADVPLTLTTVDYIDPLVQSAAIAAATSRIQISTGIYLLPMHHPLIVARAVATLQTVASGRFVFAIGVGWMPEEFEAIGVPFERRGKRADEALQILRAAQAGGVISFEGTEFSFPELTITYRPVEIPLVVGGVSKPALRRAARYGDGWLSTPNYGVEDVMRARDEMEAMRAEYGTSDREFTYYIRLATPDPELRDAYVAEGFTEFNLGAVDLFPRKAVAGMTIDEKIEVLAKVASDFDLAPLEA